MALTYFPVTATLKAAITDTSADAGGDPDVQFISCTVTFEPSVKQVRSSTDNVIYRLDTIRARTNPDDGVLKTVDGNPVSLVANTPDLELEELTYKVTFTDVQYGAHPGNQELLAYRFLAPTDDTPVDLATVDHI